MGLTKEKAIAIVTKCAKAYQENLINKTLMFVCMDKHKRISCIEFTFDASNFLHLTGFDPKEIIDKSGNKHRLSATEFYRRCLDNKLSEKDFDFNKDGTTPLKLDVLPLIINKNLSAKMIGDYNSLNPRLYTEKLVGGTKACIGFIALNESGRYVPNTVLKIDIRDYTENTVRVIAAFRKNKTDLKYSEITYVANDVDIHTIKYPEEFSYLNGL